jgi:hypothetical protein
VVSYIRTVFLEIVRVEYWRCIESGRLPRNSFSAKYLLYSIDVGLDYVKDMKKGFRDWDCIEQELSAMPWNIRILLLVEAITPNFFQIATKRLVRCYTSMQNRVHNHTNEEFLMYILAQCVSVGSLRGAAGKARCVHVDGFHRCARDGAEEDPLLLGRR